MHHQMTNKANQDQGINKAALYLFFKKTREQKRVTKYTTKHRPVGESLDLRANDQLSGLTEAR